MTIVAEPTLAQQLGLDQYGIKNSQEIVRNPSYEQLFAEETRPDLEGFERGVVTELGAVNVNTGIFTGRSPKDKYIVKDATTQDTVWWSDQGKNDNKAITPEVWSHLKGLVTKQLSGKRLFVVDGFCGANPDTRLAVRIITEVAWQAHFVKNMFIRPSDEELKTFKPDFVVMNGAKCTNPNWKEQGLNSENFVAFNMTEKMQLIGGTWYGGEMKKGMFSMMNYFLPLRGIASMHCSANVGQDGDVAIFFGLSGTGKTTLSTDPKRQLIGDDEHGWDDHGVFNFEGGCYAKTIKLSEEAEPDIYHAIRRDALLENVTVAADGTIDFDDGSKTENTRVSYPIYHIDNIVIHRQTGRYRARHHRADSDLLLLLRRSLPLPAPDQVRSGAGKTDGSGRCRGLSGQHRLERHRQAHLHQGYPRHHRRHPGWLHREGRDQGAADLQSGDPDRAARCEPGDPRPARHLRRQGRVGCQGRRSGRALHQELRALHR